MAGDCKNFSDLGSSFLACLFLHLVVLRSPSLIDEAAKPCTAKVGHYALRHSFLCGLVWGGGEIWVMPPAWIDLSC